MGIFIFIFYVDTYTHTNRVTHNFFSVYFREEESNKNQLITRKTYISTYTFYVAVLCTCWIYINTNHSYYQHHFSSCIENVCLNVIFMLYVRLLLCEDLCLCCEKLNEIEFYTFLWPWVVHIYSI